MTASIKVMRASREGMAASLQTMRASVRTMTASAEAMRAWHRRHGGVGPNIARIAPSNEHIAPNNGGIAGNNDGIGQSNARITPSNARVTPDNDGIGRNHRAHTKNGVLDLPECGGRSKCPLRSHLHDEAKEKVAPGCPPMPLPRDPPLRAGLCVGPYAAISCASSVVDWLLFALGTKRCFMSSFCSWSLVSPAGVLSMA